MGRQLSPPCRHRGRLTAQSFSAPAAPDTIRRPRSRAPRVCGVAGASGATGLVESPPVLVQRLVCSATAASSWKPRWGRAPLAPSCVLSREQGPSSSRLPGVTFMGSDPVLRDPCWVGEGAVAAFCVAAAERSTRRLRWLGRAERVNRRGRSLPCRRTRLGGSASSSGLLGGLDAVLGACDS